MTDESRPEPEKVHPLFTISHIALARNALKMLVEVSTFVPDASPPNRGGSVPIDQPTVS